MAILKGGVIGFGDSGRKMTAFVNSRPDTKIIAACNRGPGPLQIARDKYGLRTTHDPDELCQWRDVDFVLVVSTSYAHTDQVLAAARAGKHVFCEKPIALNLDDADTMIEAVEKAGVVNVVNYSLRFIDAYIKMKRFVDEGELGDLLSVWTYRTRGWGLHAAGAPPHRAVMEPQESGGWTVHHACHDLDFLSWVNGPIKSVYGQTRTTIPNTTSEELVHAICNFESGALGWVGDCICMMRDHYSGVIGSKGQVLLAGEHDTTVLKHWQEGKADPTIIPARDTKRNGGGLDHFFECIQRGVESPNSLRSARHSLASSLAVVESARTGKPVDVPRDPPRVVVTARAKKAGQPAAAR